VRTTSVCAPSVVEPRPGEGAKPLGPPRWRHLGSPLSPGRLPSTTLGADVTRVRGNDVVGRAHWLNPRLLSTKAIMVPSGSLVKR
jgi:hypothetical protein